jgi:hypothetical protein
MAQEVECLLCKHKALSSNLVPHTKKKREKERENVLVLTNPHCLSAQIREGKKVSGLPDSLSWGAEVCSGRSVLLFSAQHLV